MSGGPTAKRYAQAAFDIARNEGEIEEWLQNLTLANEPLQDDTIKGYLVTPKIPLDQKIHNLRNAFGILRPLALNLLVLLASRNSTGLLPNILIEYRKLMDADIGRERAEVVTAVPLMEEQRERLRNRLQVLLGKDIILSERIDPEILGGMVTRVGDRIIDSSLKGRLMALRKNLAETPDDTSKDKN